MGKPRRTPFRSLGRTFGFAALLSVGGVHGPSTALAAAAGGEAEPRVPAAQLAPRGVALSGPNHRVVSPVQVTGYMGQYTVRTDWGDVPAAGGTILAIRVAEVRALGKLQEVTTTQVFTDAMAASARKTGEAVQRVVTQPVETVMGIPGGVERLLRRTARTVRSAANTVGDALSRDDNGAGSGTGEAKDEVEQLVDFANEFAGVNRARREIARAMGIDPYTRNPLIQQRLGDLAYASVAGGMSFGLALGQVGGFAAEVISVTGKLDDLVWDASPADIREQLERRLVARGVDAATARGFLRTAAFTPTLQVDFVNALEALGRPTGEQDVIALAGRVRSEVHARFLIDQLRMLKRHGFEGDPTTGLVALEQSIAATTRRGRWLVALPVDRLSWAGAIADFASEASDLPQVRKVIVSGGVSDRARRELTRAGFTVVAGVGLP
jgi:hypothetical protein